MSKKEQNQATEEQEEQKNSSDSKDKNKSKQSKKEEKKDKTEELEEQIAELEQKIDEQKDKYLRLFADFDNYKKRSAKERLELIKDAGKDIMSVFLPVLDDFKRALKAAEESNDADNIKEGMELIYNKMFKALEQKGLKAMDSLGHDFDPELHEALTEIPAADKKQKGKVVDVIEDGYMLNDKIIRHAKVVVGK